MNTNLDVLAKIQQHPDSTDAHNAHIDASFASTGFDSTAWRTAQVTGALSYMPYDLAQKFSGIYDGVQDLEKTQQVLMEDEAQFLGVIRRYPMKNGAVGKEEANAMAERFGIWQGHLLAVHIAARFLLDNKKRRFLNIESRNTTCRRR